MYFYLQKYKFIGNFKHIETKNINIMKSNLLNLLFVILCVPSYTQILDDFSDGNFSENPSWIGSDSIFIVNDDLQLQNYAEIAGNSWLSIDYKKKNAMEWRFWIRENFSPSANNFTDVFLYSDSQNVNDSKTAYFLRFGESGSSDVIEFFKKENGEDISLCRGNDTFIASSFSTFVKITYDESRCWRIFVDKNGSGIFNVEMEIIDNEFYEMNDNACFGISCTFSNSNVKRFYFDDFYIGEIIIDTEAPLLTNCRVVNEHQMELTFTEALDEKLALDIDNYLVDNQLNNPKNVFFGNNLSSVILEFENIIQEALVYKLTIKKIEDLSSNLTENIVCEFSYYNHKENDIVINEIMADPEPVVELPSYEYIELYNTTDFPLNLKNWVLVIGNSKHEISEDIDIEADGYMILCHDEAVDHMSLYGKCYGFSSFQISNSGTYIALIDSVDNIISDINFDISWYDDDYKEEGGWSLEQIDTFNPCAGKLNWSSSCYGAGGTPGSLNSINNENPIRPDLDHLNMINNYIIEIFFDQKMNKESLQDVDNYFISETQSYPEEIYMLPDKNNYVELIFEHSFEENKIYTLNINNVLNCKNITTEDVIIAHFGIPQRVECNDLIINEILFNPVSTSVDYVEIFNKSDKVIDLSKILLGSINESFPNPPDTTFKEICSDSRLLMPKSYILLSIDSESVKNQYNSESDDFIKMSSFPSLPNDEGCVFISNKNKEMIDMLYYSDKMHYDLLVETKGVALERISFEKPTSDLNNWNSAAYSVNYGTPGYKNSMSVDYDESMKDDEISIIPEIFSPDGDGYDDICSIYYNFDRSGYSMNIKIFNTKGVLLRRLLENSLIEDKGFVNWNGCDDNNKSVLSGIYVVQIEVFDTQGFVKRIKKTVVIGKRF